MSTFYAATQAFYERDGKLRVIPSVLLIDAPDEDQASNVAGDYLDDTFPTPGYFDHAFEVRELDGIAFTEGEDGPSLFILSVTEEFILATPPGGNT